MRVDADALFDTRPIGSLQIRVFVFCALVALLDAVDSQAIGVAGPLMAAGLKMSPAAFAPAYSAGLLGAAIGALLFGPVSDRYGRRPALLFTTALFGVFTLLTALTNSFPLLFACRFVAGLGLGGATPCFITMAAEYAPQRSRAMFVSLLWAGYPLGNSVGGVMTSFLVARFHWPVLFLAAGAPTILVVLAMLAFLPESVRFLASGGQSDAALRIARRLDPDLPRGTEIAGKQHAPRAGIPLRELFTEGRAPTTILVGLMLYFGFATTTVIVLQTPTLFRQAGIPLHTSALLVAIYSLVATFGMAIAGRLLERFGAVAALTPPFIGGGILLASLGLVDSSPLAAGAIMLLLGLTASVGSSGAIALAATSYPTEMRSAGTGWAMALGRFGQVCSPLVIGAMLAFHWTPAQILIAMALAPVLGGICVLLKAKFTAPIVALPQATV
ncbi:MAG TPA: MFS transporter [Micropepsaceae bacterium]|nr:MFS transporter [Micropepsaceae bacterium]